MIRLAGVEEPKLGGCARFDLRVVDRVKSEVWVECVAPSCVSGWSGRLGWAAAWMRRHAEEHATRGSIVRIDLAEADAVLA